MSADEKADRPGADDELSLQLGLVSGRVSAAFDKVPSIGSGWARWYDLPYRLLRFLHTSWRRKIFPKPALRFFHRWSTDLSQFNELERARVWDPSDRLHDFKVPEDEHVNMPGIWVIELFPPSALLRLEQAIRRNGWDLDRWMSAAGSKNADMLQESRARAGWGWWRMASIQDVNGRYILPDGMRAKLPPEFGYIELKAIQVGSGLTAVVAYIQLSELGATQLDEVWHLPHEPMLTRREGRVLALDRMWAGFQVTQAARERLHQLARKWMKDNCDGIFSELKSPQTLIDMLILDQHDPAGAGSDGDPNEFDVFRALGITETGVYDYTSAEIPNMRLVPTRPAMARGLSTDRTWALWGRRESVAESATYMEGSGDDLNRAIAHRYSEAIESFLVTLAVSDMLAAIEAQYSTIRDNARSRHGRFRTGAINDLREQLLTLSIDMASVRRDLDRSWRLRPRFENEAEFRIEYSPHFQIDPDRQREPVHMNAELRRRQREWFEDLTAADRDYREILSTVASLGASAQASRTGRRALWVAFVSLAVASITVLVTDIGDNSLLRTIVEFLHSHF